MTSKIVEMHLKVLFDLDNLLADMEEPSYKEIGFAIDEKEQASLINARYDLLKKLPPDIAGSYEMLKKRYKRAIAPVEKGFCFGCFQKLPTQLLTRQEEIVSCPNCGRILYWRRK